MTTSKNQYLIIDKIESTRITSNWIQGQQSIDLIELENKFNTSGVNYHFLSFDSWEAFTPGFFTLLRIVENCLTFVEKMHMCTTITLFWFDKLEFNWMEQLMKDTVDTLKEEKMD